MRDLELAIALTPPSPLLLLALATERRGDRALALDRYAAFFAAALFADGPTRAFAVARADSLRARR